MDIHPSVSTERKNPGISYMIYEALGKVYPIIQDMMPDTIWRLLRYKFMSPEEVATLGRGLVLAAN